MLFKLHVSKLYWGFLQDKWLKDTVEACRRNRYITTIGGRRRYLTDIVSPDPKRRASAERQAINSAVQVLIQLPHLRRMRGALP